MATFVKLTHPNGEPVWINLDRVERMSRLPSWGGDRYSDQNDAGEWVESIVGARPERTRLVFGITAGVDATEDYVEVLETPDEILYRAARDEQ